MITIEYNDEAVSAALAEAFDALSDTGLLMGEIARALKDSAEDRFEDGVAPDGSAWAPNSPVTLARKKDSRPLIMTGTMSRNLHADWGADFAEVGSNAIQSAVMQFGAPKGSLGGDAPWGDIPARPFLGVSETDKDAIIDIVQEALARALAP